MATQIVAMSNRLRSRLIGGQLRRTTAGWKWQVRIVFFSRIDWTESGRPHDQFTRRLHSFTFAVVLQFMRMVDFHNFVGPGAAAGAFGVEIGLRHTALLIEPGDPGVPRGHAPRANR